MTTDTLPPQQAKFVAEYLVNGGDGTQAALAAGYSPANARFQASRLLAKANISQQIARKQATLAVQTDYSIAQWRADVLSDIQLAREAGSHSAVFKGHELLGRHIGALTDTGRVSGEQAAFFASLGAVMQQAFSSQFPSNSGKQTVIESASQQANQLT